MKITRKCLAMLLSLCLLLCLIACKGKDGKTESTSEPPTVGSQISELLLSDLASYQIVRSASLGGNDLKLLLSFVDVLKTNGKVELVPVVSDLAVLYPVQEKEIVIGETEREGSAYQLDNAEELGEGEYDFRIIGSRVIFRYQGSEGLLLGLEQLLIEIFRASDAGTVRSDYALALYNRGISRYEGFHLNNVFQDGMRLELGKTLPCFGLGQAGYEVTLQLLKDAVLLNEQKVTVNENGTWMINIDARQEANEMKLLYNGVPVRAYKNVVFMNGIFPAVKNGTKVLINGNEVPVMESEAGLQVIASLQSETETEMNIEIIRNYETDSCYVRPLSKNIDPQISGKSVKFQVTSFPAKLSVEFDEFATESIQFFLHEYEAVELAGQGEGFRYFAPGEYWYDGMLTMESGDTVYLAEGARLHARFDVKNQENITLAGRGVIDLFCFEYNDPRMLSFENCKNVTLKDYFLTGPRTWMNVLINCDNVKLDNISVIGTRINSDGVDIVGSRDVTIDGCFFRNNDDCIAIKSWQYDVARITVTNSVFWNMQYGNALEIGYETRCENISNIKFENNDIIRAEKGCTLSIHLGDRAHVSDVLYRNIRVEEAYGKFIEMFIKETGYSVDKVRGYISNVRVEDVRYVGGKLGKVIVTGDEKTSHLIQNVTILDIYNRGTKLTKDDITYDVKVANNVTWNGEPLI